VRGALRRGFLALAALFAVAAPAGAQAPGTPGRFDFYVLALSWSPGFCETTGEARGSSQCQAGRRLGFVVHGLWPQYERGYPSDCDSRGLPASLSDEAASIWPELALARYEWRKHGTCSGLSPADYLRAVRAAREKVVVPEPFALLGEEAETRPLTIERAFAAVNPGLRSDMMAVSCRRGALEEVRICLTKDLSGFRSCPEVDQRSCRFGPIRVAPPR